MDKPVKRLVESTVKNITGKEIKFTDTEWGEIRQDALNHVYAHKLQFFHPVTIEYFTSIIIQVAILRIRVQALTN